jgi:signal transduction histidine kinase
MNRRTAARVAWSIWGVSLLLWTFSFWVRTLGGVSGTGERLLSTLAFVALATAGMLVASRRPESPFGWIISAYGLLVGGEGVAIGYALALGSPGVPRPFGDGTALAWLGTWIAPVANALLTLALLLVPDGRLPSPRWRPVAALVVFSGALGAVSGALTPGALANGQPNPLAVAGAGDLLPQLRSLSRTLQLIGFAAAVLSLAVRFRGAAGEDRQQLKWVAAGAFVWVLATLAVRVNPAFLRPYLGIVYLIGLVAFVAAVTVAVLRHRLYDVDLVISRALVYGALGLCITTVYVAVVAGVGTLAGTRGEPSLVPSLVATALVAVVFQPARQRLQRLANRLVYGRRASPYEVLADFSGRIAGALSVDEVLPRMAEAAAQGVGATRSRVRVYLPGGQDRAVAWPAAALAGPFERTVPVPHQGTPVGEIAVSKPGHEPITAAEDRLLADLAAQAGPAFKNVRLDLELQARLEELQASRQRIVHAQDGARRRLERDLHDGAQQHLVALAVTARLARQLVDRDPGRAAALLDDLADQATGALTALRDLARGVFPAVLADRGLAAALGAHVARTCPATRFERAAGLDGARFPPAVEAGVYFCCLEALQNAAKHAPGAAVTLRLSAADGWLVFSLRDEGPGFDPLPDGVVPPGGAGAGLLNMADRMAALGGSLSIASAPGRGTTVTGRAPLRPASAAEADARLEAGAST